MTDDEEPSRPWRVLSMAIAISIVASGLFWLSQENGTPTIAPSTRPRAPLPPREPPRPEREFRDSLPSPASFERELAAASDSPDATRRAAALASLPALPAAEAPVGEQVAVLMDRAQAGDGVAGCRVLVARVRCDALGSQADAAACETLVRQAPGDALQRTQRWMTPRQKVLLAMLRPDGRIARLGDAADAPASADAPHVASTLLEARAYEFLLEGFRAFDPLALEGLALVHGEDPPRGSLPAMPSARTFVFYTGVLEALHGSEAIDAATRARRERARASLAPAERDRLDTQIANEARLWTEAEPAPVRAAKWQTLPRDAVELADCAP